MSELSVNDLLVSLNFINAEINLDIPVWLFMGPEIGERNKAVDDIKKMLSAKYEDIEIHSMYSADTDIGSVVSLLQNISLFSPAKLIILKSAELIKKKEDAELITNWIKTVSNTNTEPYSFLVLVSDETSILKKISDAVPKNNQKIFWEMFENKKQDWIKNFFRKEGFGIEDEAVNKILELVENNTDTLKTSCSHIVLFLEKGTTILSEDIETLFAHTKEETPFSLFDALTHNDFETSIAITQKLMLSKNSSPIQIIAGLSYCFRRLSDWHKIHEGNSYLDDFELKRYGFLGKTAIAQYGRAAKLWNTVSCSAIISLLCETDLKLRSLGSTLQSSIMEICLYEIIHKSGYCISEYATPF